MARFRNFPPLVKEKAKRLWRRLKPSQREPTDEQTDAPAAQGTEVPTDERFEETAQEQIEELAKDEVEEGVEKAVEKPSLTPATPCFMGVPPEVRLLTYEQSPITSIYTTIRSDGAGKPTVVLVLRLPERAMLQVQKAIVAREAEPELFKLTRASGLIRFLVHHQHLDEVSAALTRLRYVQATDKPLAMEDHHRAVFNAKDDEGGTIDHVQVQMWSRLANLYTNTNIEVGIWVEPGAPVGSLFAHAHQYAGDIKDPQWQDTSSTFTAVFDWPGAVNLPSTRDPEDVFDDFEREMAVVKDPSPLRLRDEWGVSSFGEAFRRAEMNQPRNRR